MPCARPAQHRSLVRNAFSSAGELWAGQCKGLLQSQLANVQIGQHSADFVCGCCGQDGGRVSPSEPPLQPQQLSLGLERLREGRTGGRAWHSAVEAAHG